MLFEWGKQVGRQLAGYDIAGLEQLESELNEVMIMQQAFSNRVVDSSVLVNPQTNLPYGSKTLLFGDTVAMPAVLASAVVLDYKCPVGWAGLLNSLAIVYTGGGFVSGSGDLVFRVEVGNRPYETLNNLTIQIGSILGNQDIAGIRIYSGQRIRIIVEHVANALLGDPVIGRIGGYIYPVARG